ncbi:MAG: selenium cofactor biosynthesis protein YqeC [Desulfobacteraceae bacterium]
MEETVNNLTAALGLEAREHLALVGGGGKTKLMFVLAEELCRAKKRVITSTTTKIWNREAKNSPYVGFVRSQPAWRDELSQELQTHGHAFLAHSPLASGKVQGINTSLADELYRDQELDYLIAEADGASGRPVKAPAEHEPVIASSVTRVVAVMGLEALGQELSPEIVFRMDLFCKLAKIQEGKRLTAFALSRLFLHPEGLFKGTPISAKRVAFLNKLDLIPEGQEVRNLADLILGEKDSQVDQVVIGSIQESIYKIVR